MTLNEQGPSSKSGQEIWSMGYTRKDFDAAMRLYNELKTQV
ncbi:MAG: hypothetical protein WA220_03150 [Candidatus Nitrosopolaris sp.]